MGFINYHGTEEEQDRFHEVSDYIQIQKTMEQMRLDDQKMRLWLAEFLGNPGYGRLEAKDTIKFVVKKHRDATDAFRRLVPGDDVQVETGQIWKDLWVFTSWNCVEAAGISGAKREQFLQVIYGKLLKLGETEEVRIACRAYEKSRKYRRYMKQCFSLREDGAGQFWRWMGEKGRRNGTDFAKLLDAFSEYTVFLSYYLYQSIRPEKDTWMYQAERTKRLLEELKNRCRNNESDAPVYRKMRNPLYAVEDREMLKNLRFRHVLLFGKCGNKDAKMRREKLAECFAEETENGIESFAKKTEERGKITPETDGESDMIEELYSYLESEIEAKHTAFDNTESILPEEIKMKIMSDILPELDGAALSGINPGEAVHYLDHGVFYCGEEKDDDISFKKYKGTFAITDKNLVFRGGIGLTVAFTEIKRIIQYDMTPEILELTTEGGKQYFFDLPDMESAYKILKLIANKNKGKSVKEEVHRVSYEELVEKADINACIFAFECLETYWLPEELKQKISLLLRKLRGLKKTIEDYPERADEILRFLTYYIPEAVGIIDAYYNYQQAELDEKTMNKLYEKITASIDTLDAAVEKKIFSIYRLETMNTTAKADALRQIMEQDGYSKDKRILKL